MVSLWRSAPARSRPVVLDDAQRAAVEARVPLLRVLGAPGTGKTTVAVEIAVDRARAGSPLDRTLLLTSSRVAAAALRDAVTARVAGTSTQPLARTHQAFGFSILRREAALAGDPLPRLITGPEQDVILRELLAGYAAGDRPEPAWPATVAPARQTRGFRAELRDLLMRAVEHGVEADELARLGVAHGRPEWVAAASVLAEYDEVTALSRPGAYDPAWVLTAAADRLEDDPEALGRVSAELDLVVVDDAQEVTSAAARLLAVLSAAGVHLVLVGDPDSAVQTFRGADPRFLASGWAQLGDGPTLVLPTSYRQGATLLGVTAAVARRIGALGGAAQRDPVPAPLLADGQVEVAMVRAVAQEGALVAARLRAAHLLDGVPWSQMAVVVRGRARSLALRRSLAAAGVPVTPGDPAVALRDERAVRPLLALLDIVARRADDPAYRPDVDTVVDLLTGTVGGTDPVALRRLRRALRAHELDSGGTRSSDELLRAALLDPALRVQAGSAAAGLARLQRALEAGLQVMAPTRSASEVLWAVWSALGVAGPWEAAALAGGPAGVRADRDLDAVLAVFDAAEGFAERLPRAGTREFLDHVVGQEVAADSLVQRAPTGEVVELVTPVAAAGRQWRYVVVAGVQEGAWPDLRLRGSLLGSSDLVDLLSGRELGFRAAHSAVRYDETRLFHVAVSRASERLLVTAVRSEDEQPSVYLDIVDPLSDPDPQADGLRPFTEVDERLSVPSLVAGLRRDLARSEGSDADAAAVLAALAERGVPGAAPSTWWPRLHPTDDRPVVEPDRPVRVSPSALDGFQKCGLRWLLTTRGGSGPSSSSQTLGSLVHSLAHELGAADAGVYRAELDRRWGELGLPRSWATDKQHELAATMVTRLAAYLGAVEAAGWEPVGSEVDLRVELGRAVVSGRVDRLERRTADGALRVVDLKTGSSKPSGAELARHPQLGAYQEAVEAGAFGELGSVSAGAALVQVGKAAGTTASPSVQAQPAISLDAEPGWARELVAAAAEGMSAGSLVAAPGGHCRVCPVTTSCPVRAEGERL